MPGLVAQSCNPATGGLELWDGWRLLRPQLSWQKHFCGRTKAALVQGKADRGGQAPMTR